MIKHPTLLLWASLGLLASDPGHAQVTGVVADSLTGSPLAGATVELLADGVWCVESTQTQADGSYVLTPSPGTYDVRARSGSSELEYLGDLHADVVVGAGPVTKDFALVSLAQKLAELGIDPGLYEDTDGDGLPDPVELEVGSDPQLEDTNGDGVGDGISVWVGADPLTGAAATSAEATVEFPQHGGVVALAETGPNPPLGLIFAPVPGATGYQVRLISTAGVAEFVGDFDAETDLVLGEWGALAVDLPSNLSPGVHSIEVQGYYGSSATPVGSAGCQEVLLELLPMPAVVLSSSTNLSGVVACDSLVIEAGVQVDVPVGEHLIVFAGTGGVTIDPGAALRGVDGAVPGAITILSRGDVVLHGELAGGNGSWGAPEVVVALPGDDAFSTGGTGSTGADARVFGLAQAVVSSAGRVSSGTGGRGGDAQAWGGTAVDPAVFGGDAQATGGKGGAGGDLFLCVADVLMAYRPGVVHSGNGGDGADAMAWGGDGGPGAGGGSAAMISGVGGASGNIMLSRWDALEDGFEEFTSAGYAVTGGNAGDEGDASQGDAGESQEVGGDCACSSHKKGRDAMAVGIPGENGWARGGRGSMGKAIAGNGVGCGAGGEAYGEGGRGGIAGLQPGSLVGVQVSPTGYIRIRRTPFFIMGGRGGDGLAIGGNGGPEGGDGGAGRALGGSGGDGIKLGSAPVRGTGGAGGNAFGYGGMGGRGLSCCPELKPGLDGGDGGLAEANGGQGGRGQDKGGDGGDGYAVGGHGGDGGDGCPPGFPGQGADGTAQFGVGGVGIKGTDGEDGEKYEFDGDDGSAGTDCCVHH